jgi:uncharacterized protein (TIGR02246 family)
MRIGENAAGKGYSRRLRSVGAGVALLAVLILVLTAGGAAETAGDQESFRAAARETMDRYEAAMNAGDAESWLSLWHEDGVQLPPGRPPVEGKEAISQGIRGAFGAIDFQEFSVDIQDTQRAGDLAYAWGVYSYRQTPQDGGPSTSFEGKFLTVYHNTDAGWMIYRDAFNANVPPQA